jgi:sigma-E factor negative regulatory protein RseA
LEEQGVNDRIKESLSAFMDGEADELEVQRVVAGSDSEEVRATWARYHVVRSVMQQSASANVVAAMDVTSSVREAIADQQQDRAQVAAPRSAGGPISWLRPVASFAVAASVAGAVVVGSQWLDGSRNVSGETATVPFASAAQAPSSGWGGVPITASIRSGAQNRPAAVERAAVYDALARERLQRYMLHNAEHAALNNSQGMMPFARVASMEKK